MRELREKCQSEITSADVLLCNEAYGRERQSEAAVFKGAVLNNSEGGVWSDSDAAGGCSETRQIRGGKNKETSSCLRLG